MLTWSPIKRYGREVLHWFVGMDAHGKVHVIEPYAHRVIVKYIRLVGPFYSYEAAYDHLYYMEMMPYA